MNYTLCAASFLLACGQACIAPAATSENNVKLTRVLIRLLSEGAGDEDTRESSFRALKGLGPIVDLAFTEELAAEKRAENRFLLLQFGETLMFEGIALDSALLECLTIAIEHCQLPEYLDYEVASYASGLAAAILAKRCRRISESELSEILDRPGDPFAKRVVQTTVLFTNRLLDHPEPLNEKK